MAKQKPWFEVDKSGLGKLILAKNPATIIFELVQNAFDETPTVVEITLERLGKSILRRLTVRDNSPTGFKNLDHAFTLFAESEKKGDTSKRGRFNLGEKLVLAVAHRAKIISTTGAYEFTKDGRRKIRDRTTEGSIVTADIPLTDNQIEECENSIQLLLVPPGIHTTYNGTPLTQKSAISTTTASLPTEYASGDGVLRQITEKIEIEIYEPIKGHPPTLYEMGIPVLPLTEDRWSINITKKIPLGFNRDNVSPRYLSLVRAAVLETMISNIPPEDIASSWVRDTLQRQGSKLKPNILTDVAEKLFGDKRVSYDPSDIESNSRATAAGYNVIHGGQLSRKEWDVFKTAGLIKPAGQVTPSPKPFSKDGLPLNILQEDNYTPSMVAVVRYIKKIAIHLIGTTPTVTIADDHQWPFLASYGEQRLTLNGARLTNAWFDNAGTLDGLTKINDLMIHEFAHHFESNHLSEAYYDALSLLGAKLTGLALTNPAIFPQTNVPLNQC